MKTRPTNDPTEVEVEIIAGGWVSYKRGLRAIIEETKRRHHITCRGYGTPIRHLIGLRHETITRSVPGTPLVATQLLVIALAGSRISIREMYELNLEDPEIREVTNDLSLQIQGKAVHVIRHMEVEAVFDLATPADNFIEVCAYASKQRRTQAMGDLGITHPVLGHARGKPQVPASWIIKAHLYTGIPIAQLTEMGTCK
jgi:hypothetical protein